MQRRTRYLFIGLGALFFLIAAPVMIFYVGGVRYSFKDNQYSQTGILSIITDPKKVQVLLDGQQRDEAPVDLRFLEPKEYTVSLHKDGYWDWSKRLEVKAGKATIASDALDKIYLLKKTDNAPVVSNEVIDYAVHDTTLVYLTAHDVNQVAGDKISQTKTITLAQQYDRLLSSPHGNYMLLLSGSRTQVLNVSSWRLSDVTSSVVGLSDMEITDSGLLLARRNSNLISVDPVSKHEAAVLSNISSFTVLGQNLYYIQTIDDKSILAVVPLANASTTTPQRLQTLPANLASARLLITEQKDVLLYANNNLYKVNQALDLIAEGVQQYYFDSTKSILLYATSGELSWYEFIANEAHLITRNTQAIVSPQLDPSIGYAFYMQNGQVMAMELDNRDHQNNYALLPAPQGQSVRLGSDHKTLYILDGQTLKLLEIR